MEVVQLMPINQIINKLLLNTVLVVVAEVVLDKMGVLLDKLEMFQIQLQQMVQDKLDKLVQ